MLAQPADKTAPASVTAPGTRRFRWVYEHAVRRSDLPGTAKLLLLDLVSHTLEEHGEDMPFDGPVLLDVRFAPSVAALMESSSYSRRTVEKHVRLLQGISGDHACGPECASQCAVIDPARQWLIVEHRYAAGHGQVKNGYALVVPENYRCRCHGSSLWSGTSATDDPPANTAGDPPAETAGVSVERSLSVDINQNRPPGGASAPRTPGEPVPSEQDQTGSQGCPDASPEPKASPGLKPDLTDEQKIALFASAALDARWGPAEIAQVDDEMRLDFFQVMRVSAENTRWSYFAHARHILASFAAGGAEQLEYRLYDVEERREQNRQDTAAVLVEFAIMDECKAAGLRPCSEAETVYYDARMAGLPPDEAVIRAAAAGEIGSGPADRCPPGERAWCG